jgi:2-methylcitrate dehydratase PrpD
MGTVTATDTLLGRLACRWSGIGFADLPAEVTWVGRHCLLDWCGCALAGSREPLARLLQAEIAGDGDGETDGGRAGSGPSGERTGGGPATVLGAARTARARDAALANGAAGHALDFDDTHTRMPGHPTAPVLPAALAVAEQLDATGEQLLTALVVGVEVEVRVGALLAPGHYAAGWHATGTVGTLGAAAAVAHLLGLDPERTMHALALAATQAAGLKASFGTMAKPLHAGKAASDGLLAARLAAGGFTGNPAVLEAPQGMAAATVGVTPDPARLDRLDDRWTIRDTLFKYHAACYLTHAAINAALALADRVGPDEIERVEVRVGPDLLEVCNIAEPATGLEGKFSLRATTAMALLGDDTTDMASYTDTRMGAADLVALRDRVAVVAEDGRASTSATLVVTTRGGERLEAGDDTGRPAEDLDVQWDRLSAKFRALATPVIGPDAAAALHTAVAGLAPARAIARAAAG